MQTITNKIALEEHFCAPGLEPSIKDVAFFDPEVLRSIELALPEVSEQRLKAMDSAGISIQVLSQTAPGVQSIKAAADAVELARRANDCLQKHIEFAPERFRGFACLPLQDVDTACDELKRCVEELGFVGALINGSTNGAYPAILNAHVLERPYRQLLIGKPDHAIPVIAFDQDHGTIISQGFRFGPLAYSSDVVNLDEEAFAALAGVECWIVDALRYTPHPTHAHVDKALAWIDRVRPKRAVLTNLHIDLDYQVLRNSLPDCVEPAFDGMVIEV